MNEKIFLEIAEKIYTKIRFNSKKKASDPSKLASDLLVGGGYNEELADEWGEKREREWSGFQGGVDGGFAADEDSTAVIAVGGGCGGSERGGGGAGAGENLGGFFGGRRGKPSSRAGRTDGGGGAVEDGGQLITGDLER
ncbi:uncharacterized protein LOC131018930 [Salvia miltiorrhiza]|uniref:uncharacterized protein LOC131018930 n=1 Tax=Salvia miltiorrhiza TaxID=226208 RepID=UPI0025ABB338|nr:uncharacterized protein LOC131018930 [Salvia miltiorrhiza]